MGDTLTGHPDVAMVAFTGSRDVGLHILSKAHEIQQGFFGR